MLFLAHLQVLLLALFAPDLDRIGVAPLQKPLSAAGWRASRVVPDRPSWTTAAEQTQRGLCLKEYRP